MSDPMQVLLGPRPDPGHGVFETWLVVDGAPLELEPHIARLEGSLRTLYDEPLPLDAGALVADAARGLALGRLRLTLVPQDGALASSVLTAPIDRELVLGSWGTARALAPVAVPGWNGAHKWADRRLLEGLEAALAPASPLLVDGDGTVLETSRGNVFAVRDGVLATPPADGRILPGVTRELVLSLAGELGLEARERELALDELLAADELFVTGAVRGIEPVRECADRSLAEGPVTSRLVAALRARWLAPDVDSPR